MDGFDQRVLHHPVRICRMIECEPDGVTNDGKEPEKDKAEDHGQPLWPNLSN